MGQPEGSGDVDDAFAREPRGNDLSLLVVQERTQLLPDLLAPQPVDEVWGEIGRGVTPQPLRIVRIVVFKRHLTVLAPLAPGGIAVLGAPEVSRGESGKQGYHAERFVAGTSTQACQSFADLPGGIAHQVLVHRMRGEASQGVPDDPEVDAPELFRNERYLARRLRAQGLTPVGSGATANDILV